MTTQITEVAIDILGKIYHVKCPTTNLEALTLAARFLEQKLDQARKINPGLNLERIAIITALNIANDLLSLKQEKITFSQLINQKLHDMQNNLDESLMRFAQMEFHSAE